MLKLLADVSKNLALHPQMSIIFSTLFLLFKIVVKHSLSTCFIHHLITYRYFASERLQVLVVETSYKSRKWLSQKVPRIHISHTVKETVSQVNTGNQVYIFTPWEQKRLLTSRKVKKSGFLCMYNTTNNKAHILHLLAGQFIFSCHWKEREQ